MSERLYTFWRQWPQKRTRSSPRMDAHDAWQGEAIPIASRRSSFIARLTVEPECSMLTVNQANSLVQGLESLRVGPDPEEPSLLVPRISHPSLQFVVAGK